MSSQITSYKVWTDSILLILRGFNLKTTPDFVKLYVLILQSFNLRSNLQWKIIYLTFNIYLNDTHVNLKITLKN